MIRFSNNLACLGPSAWFDHSCFLLFSCKVLKELVSPDEHVEVFNASIEKVKVNDGSNLKHVNESDVFKI